MSASRGELLPAPAQISRELYERHVDEFPFPHRFPHGRKFSCGHPDARSGARSRIPRHSALLAFIRMSYVCTDCAITWDIDDLDGRTTRIVPCPHCSKMLRNATHQYCIQGYMTYDDYLAAKEHIRKETEMWGSVDELEKKAKFNPYERMAKRRTARMRREERELRSGRR